MKALCSSSANVRATSLQCRTIRERLRPRPSPFVERGDFVSDDDRILLSIVEKAGRERGEDRALRAGARETIYFDPKDTTAAIVTCGGLCPGLNDVVRSVVHKLSDYGVPEDRVLGVRYGFGGFFSKDDRPVYLTRKSVEDVHLRGGTVLGTSRGGTDVGKIVQRLSLWGVDHLYVIGGNGSHAGAAAIRDELVANDVDCAVVCVPKTIDNDIEIVDKTFGFDTAVEESQRALLAAKVEASSARRGVGIVKLMGRQSGFIATQASMASGVVDLCIVPEVEFDVGRVAEYVDDVLASKGHAVVCVAEGAFQGVESTAEKDASGNPVLRDAGKFLKTELAARVRDVDVKYIDPSYMIRSTPANSGDRILCKVLGHSAVHAAFSGYTGVTVGLVNGHYALLPIERVIEHTRRVDPNGQEWRRLRASNGQPDLSGCQ